MKRYRITLTSKSPGMLPNQMDEKTLMSLFTGIRVAKPKLKDESKLPELLREVAEKALYKDEEGRIGIPSENIYAMLVEAGRKVKLGTAGSSKKMVSNADSTELFSFLEIEEDFVLFPPDTEWRPFPHRGRLDNGTAVCIVRPRIPHWSLTFHVIIDESVFSPDRVPELLQAASRSVGLCDWRPGCKGRFGRFNVKEFVEVEATAEQKETAAA